MKKLLLISTVLTSVSFTASAQEVNAKSKQPSQKQAMWEYGTGSDQKIKADNFQTASAEDSERKDPSRRELREQRQERYRGQTDQQQGMNNNHPHQEMFKNLTEEQKKAVKAEMDRHRAAMKQITGFDIVPEGPKGEKPRDQERNDMDMPKEAAKPMDEMSGDKSPQKGFAPQTQPEEKFGSSEAQEQRPERKRFLRNPSRRQPNIDSSQNSMSPEQAQ